jgi:hypothetical protein
MSNFAAWARGVIVLSILCRSGLLWRLWRENLIGSYPFLAWFVLAELGQNLLVLPLAPSSASYRIAYVAVDPIIWLLAYFVVAELFRLILEDYPGILSAGRKALKWSLILAVVVSVISVLPTMGGAQPRGQYVFFRFFVSIEKSVILGLLIFLVLIQAFLARYRLCISHNRVLYSVGYALYFGLGMALAVLANGLVGVRLYGVINIGMLVIADLVLLSGAFALSREGEERPLKVDEDTSTQRAHLQAQLVQMNRLLSRAAMGSSV